MKILYLLFLVFISFSSCSNSEDPIIINDGMQMEDDMNMGDEEPTSAYSGNFVSSAHPTSGMVTINEDLTKLIFENFNTDDGPLLEVYLATDTTASDFISLGVLQGTFGDYEYVLPENVDYSKYNHVIIWCVTFSVNFGYAVLE